MGRVTDEPAVFYRTRQDAAIANEFGHGLPLRLTSEAIAEREHRHDLVFFRRLAECATILPFDVLMRMTAQTHPRRTLRPDGGHRE